MSAKSWGNNMNNGLLMHTEDAKRNNTEKLKGYRCHQILVAALIKQSQEVLGSPPDTTNTYTKRT
jgi:hypothetical protein